ncbi:COMM domain-containing protein 5 [Armadillidium vulgare]|nr:COMM domain-containing protein 5 [Armadillidium vulgare]
MNSVNIFSTIYVKPKQCSDDEDVLKLSIVYSGVVSLLRAVLKINMKTVRESTLQKDLIGLGIPEDLASDVCKIAFGPAHSNIMREIVANNPHLPKLEAFNWSVDVTLSNNWSSKVLEPLVNMTMKTTDGNIHKFEVPISSFHLLRHSIATVLRNMETLERRK